MRPLLLFLIPVFSFFLMLHPASVLADMSEAYDNSTDPQKIAWMRVGMDAVKEKLRDPDSAKFKNVFFHRGRGNIPATCGYVNARNSFGGYTGFERFVSAGAPERTVLESEMADFWNIWSWMCEE